VERERRKRHRGYFRPHGTPKDQKDDGKPKSPKGDLEGIENHSEVLEVQYDKINDYMNGHLDVKLSEEDERKLLIARDSWDSSLVFFHTPAIPNPRFLFDNSRTLGFFIETTSWQTTMNLANSPQLVLDKEIFDYYHALALHEISHYIVCPYDILTNARLLKSALKHVSPRLAPIVVNIFADLLIDLKLYKKKPKEMLFELQQSKKMAEAVGKSSEEPSHSQMYKIMMKCYELMWGVDLGLPKEQYEDITPIAERITAIIMKDFEDDNTWEKKVSKIASLLKENLESDFPLKSITLKGEFQNDRTQTSNTTTVPADVEVIMGNPTENKGNCRRGGGSGGDSGKKGQFNQPQRGGKGDKREKEDHGTNPEDEQKAEQIAKDMSMEEFAEVNRALGGLVEEGEVIATYYRGISKGLIEIKVIESQPSGNLPIGIDTWRVGDSLEDLDVLQTVLVSPKIIPNLTTRKWIYKEGPGIEVSKKLPDLLLVVDSSGSMCWQYYKENDKHPSPYHLALVASFAAMDYAMKKGVNIAAINFSEMIRMQTWTRDTRKIEKVLLSYQAMGTLLPIKNIKKICQEGDRKSLCILITDFQIFNWKDAFQDIVDVLQMGNRIIGFFIGGTDIELQNDDFKTLESMGARFYPIQNIDDLIGLVVKEVKEGIN
jgi:hypothetical protein